jgi:uncharacterized protein
MTTRDEPWPQGTPCWVDLMVPEVGAARTFYSELFGWQMRDTAEEAGGYTIAELHGRPAAGVGATPPDSDVPPWWTTYLAVDDVDTAVTKVTEAGGQVFMAPMDVMSEGRMAVAVDPTGAVFGLWQAKNHKGAEIVNEPGAVTWNECMSRDYDRARAFYAEVFGFDLEEVGDGNFKYSVLNLGDQPVGGLGEIGEQMPAETPAHWLSYFSVVDTDAALKQATGLGAQVLMEPEDTPYGRMAVLRGPQGESFAVIAG